MLNVLQLAKNTVGRDFVVGDIHGEVAKLHTALDEVAFDPHVDRLFSVGDFIDVGPDSMAALSLLDEPWFFAVKGNHELMMIEYGMSGRDPWNWMSCGGEWARYVGKEFLRKMAHRLNALPEVIIVGDDEDCFRVVHAELPFRNDQLERLSAEEASNVMWDRKLVAEFEVWFNYFVSARKDDDFAYEFDFLSAHDHYRPVQKDIPLTFCGHNIMPAVILWRSHLFVDGGAGWMGDRGKLNVVNVADASKSYKKILT